MQSCAFMQSCASKTELSTVFHSLVSTSGVGADELVGEGHGEVVCRLEGAGVDGLKLLQLVVRGLLVALATTFR